MDKILVTGCAGFIGSTLTDKLLELGHEVVGISRFPSHLGLKCKNLEKAMKNRNFKLIKGNIIGLDLKKIIKENNITIIFHAAGRIRANPEYFNTFVRDNVLPTQFLLEACKGIKIKKFVLFSSCAVYGNHIASVDESTPMKPTSFYGITKLMAETVCDLYARTWDIPVISLRCFTVYGRRQDSLSTIQRFIKNIREGKTITLSGASEFRDFVHVNDVVEAGILAMNSKFENNAFNIGSGCGITYTDLVRRIENNLNKKAIIEIVDRSSGLASGLLAEIGKAEVCLKWKPIISLKEGLADLKGEK